MRFDEGEVDLVMVSIFCNGVGFIRMGWKKFVKEEKERGNGGCDLKL